MAKKKGLNKQQIAALFLDSDDEDVDLDELFSQEEIRQANEDPVASTSGAAAGDEGDLDLDFDLSDDDDENIAIDKSE